ncbi:V-set and transmembrane domain-containing protein 2-like protein isoform X2 [Dunckerocampus dactyliophorus]|uniref:V-set and transmembrane domain-containing protein 2-like protein isoform X2 n=1 Tax=Dunckerocampus dactyliophorus TaxID=161453 RepID=UPI002406F5B8|nr:V-set and transmembrane domain-containing protein 2-like protein isoform X2 [Dunckerocampus dactyliophorus]
MRAIVGLVHYVGLYVQLNVALIVGHVELDNHLSGNALFTEVPHDVTTRSGEDVEMACSFRGAGSPSSLEIQWWYVKDHRDWREKPAQITNDVVKVAGSNISHKLCLSSVKPSDEGTYECRVIDFSGSEVQHHRVRAHLHVEPGQGSDIRFPGSGHRSDRDAVHRHEHNRHHRKQEAEDD